MKTEFITQNSRETKELGKLLAKELRGGEVICLFGELGAGKTTFTQGLMEGLGAEKPYTSPTFVVMKEYDIKAKIKKQESKMGKITTVYHFDAYRVDVADVANLGWEEIISDEANVCIVEWADKLKKIIPERAVWIGFEWLDAKRRKLIVGKNIKKLAKIPKAC